MNDVDNGEWKNVNNKENVKVKGRICNRRRFDSTKGFLLAENQHYLVMRSN